MQYFTYADMATAIRRNLWKVPSDIDLIVGVPRSGMIAALMLAETMNKRVADLDAFIAGQHMSSGGRGRNIRPGMPGKVLIIDDTVNQGVQMAKVRERLEPLKESYNFLFGCIYAEGRDAKAQVDLFLVDNYREGEDRWTLYEWNILHHYKSRSQAMIWDIDGLLCKEPPDERQTAAYEAYLPKAVPMIIPTTKIGMVCTYRLDKYRKQTEDWLRRHGIDYEQLVMAPNRHQDPAAFKAAAYRSDRWQLFMESNDKQAARIHDLTGKPVYCYDTNRMYI